MTEDQVPYADEREQEIFEEYVEHIARQSSLFTKDQREEVGIQIIDILVNGALFYAVTVAMRNDYSEVGLHERINDMISDIKKHMEEDQ